MSNSERDVNLLPDGSAFFVASMPLPRDHWLYADHDNVPPMGFRTGVKHPQASLMQARVVAAARYAVRAATMNGAVADFDPDALVQNMVIGLLGYVTPDGLSDELRHNPQPVPKRVLLWTEFEP